MFNIWIKKQSILIKIPLAIIFMTWHILIFLVKAIIVIFNNKG